MKFVSRNQRITDGVKIGWFCRWITKIAVIDKRNECKVFTAILKEMYMQICLQRKIMTHYLTVELISNTLSMMHMFSRKIKLTDHIIAFMEIRNINVFFIWIFNLTCIDLFLNIRNSHPAIKGMQQCRHASVIKSRIVIFKWGSIVHDARLLHVMRSTVLMAGSADLATVMMQQHKITYSHFDDILLRSL